LCIILRESIEYRNPSSHAGEIIDRNSCEEAKSFLKEAIKKIGSSSLIKIV
jgi:hypothetical protein